MNTKFKVILVFALIGIFIANFIVQHSSMLLTIYNLERNVNINIIRNHFRSERVGVDGAQDRDDADSKVKQMHDMLESSESKVFSQNGEDGVLEKLIEIFNLTSAGYYVEIGAGDGHETNTRILREFHSWNGIMFDSTFQNQKINLFAESVTHLNLLKIFKKYKILNRTIDVFSVDTDFADYWLLEKALVINLRPKLVIHEVNREDPSKCVTTPKLNGLAFWDNVSTFYGGSVCAFYCLARRFDYSMVYCEKAGVNCFWVRNDLLAAYGLVPEAVQRKLTPEALFREARLSYHISDRKWHFVEKC